MKKTLLTALSLIILISCSEKEGFKNQSKDLGDLNPQSNNLDLLLDTFNYIVVGQISAGQAIMNNYATFDSMMNIAGEALKDSLNYQMITFDSAYIFDTNIADSASAKELRLTFSALDGEGESETFYLSFGLFRLGNNYNLPGIPVGSGGWLKACVARYSCTGCEKIYNGDSYDCNCLGGQEIDNRANCIKSSEVNNAIMRSIFSHFFFYTLFDLLGYP